MQNNHSTPSIFMLPIQDKYLLYAPLHDFSALLNRAAVLEIKQALEPSFNGSVHPDLDDLVAILQAPPIRTPDRRGESNPPFLGIIPSRRCNMSCVYCDFGAHQTSNQVIDPNLVTVAIDYLATLSQKQNKKLFSIQFFGGEPFVEQEIVDIAVHHARFIGARIGLIPHFEVLSNGYFNEQQRIFIKDYFDQVVISFDGFPKYHNRTRPVNSYQGSFQKVSDNIKFLADSNVDLAIRCCITAESVDDMEEMAQWFCTEFKPDKVNFETLTENAETEKAGLRPPAPYQFARNMVRSWRVLRSHAVEPAYAPVSLDKVQTTSCPVGRDVLIVHPDGLVASCYLLKKEWEAKNLDLNVGQVHPSGHMDLDFEKIENLRNLMYTKPRCENCFCRFGCAGNCHVNCTWPGSSRQYTDFCIHTRIITACQILEEMDQQRLVDELLANEKALNMLAQQKSDRLSNFEG